MTEKPSTPDPARPRKPDLRAFGQAVRFRDHAARLAVAHHERCGLQPSSQYARATFDAIVELIRKDERERLAAAGWQPPETPRPVQCPATVGDGDTARRMHPDGQCQSSRSEG